MRALVIAIAATACTHVASDFVCMTDVDCTSESGTAGYCESNQRCSFADSGCASGFRYTELAGDASNQCTAVDDCITEMRAGVDDTCIRRSDGTVWCWGNGALGASQVALPAGEIAQLDTAGDGLCARYADDKLHCTNGGDIAVAAADVAVGTDHVCATTADGHVACWGANDRGQLGDNTTIAHAAPANVMNLAGVTHLASGLQTSCAIKSNGEVWCWGDDNRGQIGRGFTTDENSAVPVQALVTESIAGVAIGDFFTCGVAGSGNVWCWGEDDHGENGDGAIPFLLENDAPVQVTSLMGIVQVTAGGAHACALAGDGHAWCWGGNTSHEAAASAASMLLSPTPVVDANGNPVLFHDISAGAKHTCGRAVDGSLQCWGSNAKAQLGDGTFDAAVYPTLVKQLACH